MVNFFDRRRISWLGGIVRKLIAVLIIAIIVGAITATTVASPWKFAVLSDLNYADGHDLTVDTLEFLVGDIKNQGVDLVIFPGDLIAGGDDMMKYTEQLDSWKAMMKPLYDAGIPTYVIRGNHEAETKNMIDDSHLWLREFPVLNGLLSPDGGFTYSFVHKNAKFVGFDQYINPKGRMMNSWVTTQINDSTSPLNFAFAHEPLTGKRHSMSADPNSRDALISALGNHHGAYFAGHEHLYLRANVSDGQGHEVPMLIVGTAGHNNYDYASAGSNLKGPNSGYHTQHIISRRSAYTVDKVYGNSTDPYFGYLLVTVYDNNTWTGEFKGFQYTSDILNTRFPAIQILDHFSILQE